MANAIPPKSAILLSLVVVVCTSLCLCPKQALAQGAVPSKQQLDRWLKRFPEADANGDGRLTADEAMAYRDAARAMRDGRGKVGGTLAAKPELKFDPGWGQPEFPSHAIGNLSPREILATYKKGPEARSAPSRPTPLTFPKPDDGGLRIVGVGHSFMAPAYGTLPSICKAAGIDQKLCLHTGGGVTGSARYKWEQENGIFQFDRKPIPKLLAAIANGDWEAMTWGAYYDDRPEFYTCWINYCTRFHPEMKFYLADAWPQLYQLRELKGLENLPKSESFFTADLLDELAEGKNQAFSSVVREIRNSTTKNIFVIPTNDAVTLAAKYFLDGKLPGVQGIHRVVGGKERSIWRDQTGHLGPGFDRLEGYVFYATLYGKSPELIEAPIKFKGSTGHPSKELDKIFREIAWKAVSEHPLSGVKDANQNGISDRLE